MTLQQIDRSARLAHERILAGDDEALQEFTFQVREHLLGYIDMRPISNRIPAEEIGRLVQIGWLEALLIWQPAKQPSFAECYVKRLRRLAADWFCRERDLVACVMLEEVV